MSERPPVPETGSDAPPVAPSSLGAASDPVETGRVDPNTLAADNAKLEAVKFSHTAKVQSFYFVLYLSSALFLLGAILFTDASHRMFGWQTILILFAFFAPATLLLTVLIKATHVAEKANSEEKKDELIDGLPSVAFVKALADLVNKLGK